MEIIFVFGSVTLAVIYSVGVMLWLRYQSSGTPAMREISEAIQVGSRAYLNRQYRTVALVAVPLALIIMVLLGREVAAGFLLGAVASAFAGYIGMMVAVRSNAKTAAAAEHGLVAALTLAFRAGSVTGFMVVALALAMVTGLYLWTESAATLIGLGFGASLVSVFARLGGGIFTKAADVGTDLVGKIEAGIPEDDPRNPGVIADNVGDNVGDCAGMAADLFETYAITLIAALLLGGGSLPLVLGGAAIIASVVGSFFVRPGRGTIMGALYKGLAASLVIAAVLFYFLLPTFFLIEEPFRIFMPLVVGLAVTALIVLVTDYYTAQRYRPVRSIAVASQSGHGTNIIMGLSVGMEATFVPVLIIIAGTLASFFFGGLQGVALAAVAMLSVAGVIIATDSFGPITDNASGIAEMTGAPAHIRTITDALDAVGNTTKAITKGYAIASAGLAALVLFAIYTDEVRNAVANPLVAAAFSLQNPQIIAGLLLGAALPYLFSALTIRAVGEAAGAVVGEIRRQFREIPGLREGMAKPDYSRAVDIVTRAALRKMVVPALLPIIFVIAAGTLIGLAGLGGLLIGTIISGLFLALSMTAGGAAWDNAKKFIEEGNFGGKGSEAHRAAVTGDTVGDPYKDTAGPAINPLIKVVNIVALLLVPFL